MGKGGGEEDIESNGWLGGEKGNESGRRGRADYLDMHTLALVSFAMLGTPL